MDLFHNPNVEKMIKQMSPEQFAEYQKSGKYLYENFDEKKADVKKKPLPIEDVLAYATEGLKAGLHPKDLSMEEIQALTEHYGKEWYKNYGYKKDEVPEPFIELMNQMKLTKEQRRELKKKMKKDLRKEGVNVKKI